ncbi:aminotransferase family protein [Anthocerotibacter panamensis]|uniref:aminotransferase family protein n=1 Tax=Anthocerotibacter panamensis TaxID=2857077 RepID=UPI001C403140|nr:aminotransferase [Anthocerotibacter panamensis]
MNTTPHLQELDCTYLLHPFTNHQDMHREGTHIIRSGSGCFVIDEQGKTLLDGMAGLWCVNVGYGRKELVEAVYQQMLELPYYCSFLNSTTEPTILLAQRLAGLAPARLNHTMFNSSGSESNETALKIIRGYYHLTGRPEKTKILTRRFSYHGVTLATTSMTGLVGNTAPFGLPLAGYIHVPGPHAYGVDSDLDPVAFGQWCLEETARIIEMEDPRTIAAFFVEPIQGAGGVIVPPEGYLKSLRELCRQYDILFVADEVITGFGRVGDWFASNLWELDPDLLTMAKGLTSGYLPLGATMVSDEIAEVLEQGTLFAHGYTYSGHPTPCACALANLDLMSAENLIPRVRTDIGPYFQAKLLRYKDHPAVGEVRGGYGLIGALDLLPKGGKAALDPKAPLGAKAARLLREEGLIVRGIRDAIAFSPPLIITMAEVDQLFAAVDRMLERLLPAS